MSQLSVKVESFTPTQAVESLNRLTPKQRKFEKKYAMRLASEMVRGNWRLNGEAIKFSDTHLLDGQHRLHAVYLAQRTIDFLVIRGLPDDVFDSFDQGKKRSVADVLGANSEQYASTLAAGISLILAAGPVIKHETPSTRLLTASLSPIEAERFITSYPKVRKSAEVARKYYARKLIHPSMVTALHWIFGQTVNADVFACGMKEGFHPTFKDQQALHLFREIMIANSQSHKRLRRHYILAYAILAINAAVRGEKLKVIEWNRDQPFPQPQLKP